MNRLLIALIASCCIGGAYAQAGGSVTVLPDSQAQNTSKTVDPSATAAQPNMLCPKSGTRVNRSLNTNSQRATDCATAVPGRVYSRDDIDRTGAVSTADALRRMDPAIH